MPYMVSVILVPNSHIDPIWLWRWSEGQQVIRSTFSSATELLKNRKNLVFSASSASFYKLVEKTDPVLFDNIKTLVERNQWQIVGGWWVEPDCNIPSGEALVRHSLYAQRYFMSRFGVKARVGFNIDSFGHSATIPQILRKSGIDYYVFMRPGQHEKELPSWVFRWASPDGSEVIAHRIIDTYAATGERMRVLVSRVIDELKPPLDALLCFIGQGDHGGGPTVDDLKIMDELREEVKPVELRFAPVEEFFEKAEKLKDSLPLISEELQHHASGCYAAVSRVKELNRKVEESLVAAEKYNFMANALVGTEYRSDDLYKAWTNLLFCQFHDVLAGSCIREAYEGDVFPMMQESLSIANEISDISTQAIAARVKADAQKSVIVFNPHTYPVRLPVEVNWIGSEVPRYLRDSEGNNVRCQIQRGSALTGNAFNVIFVADLPALGYRTYDASVTEEVEDLPSRRNAEDCLLENGVLKVAINKSDGTISSLTLKDDNRAVITEGAKPIVINDESDTWSHGVFRYDDEIGRFECERVEVVEKGQVRTVIRAEYRYGDSKLRQDFILYNDLDYLTCRVKVDWHERMKILKLAFPVRVEGPEATYEVQYGFIKRPTDGEEEPGLRWVDVTDKADSGEVLGATLVNDAKYSYDVRDNAIRLTVLRSPAYAHHIPNEINPDEDCEFTDQGEQRFTYVIRPHVGALNPREAIGVADVLTAPPLAITEHKHDGTLPNAASLVSVSEENVILKVIKKSEEKDSWVLRLYETSGKQTKVTVTIPPLGVQFESDVKPHEIRTYAVSQMDRTAKEVSLIEEEIRPESG